MEKENCNGKVCGWTGDECSCNLGYEEEDKTNPHLIKIRDMREIKFRAWDKDGKKMYFDGFSISTSGRIEYHTTYWGETSHLDLTLMQFTGLLDKNGKEIYERDIVQLSKTVLDKVEVFFKDGAFCVFDVNGKDVVPLVNNLFLEDFIIIGNIYENPELLK